MVNHNNRERSSSSHTVVSGDHLNFDKETLKTNIFMLISSAVSKSANGKK